MNSSSFESNIVYLSHGSQKFYDQSMFTSMTVEQMAQACATHAWSKEALIGIQRQTKHI
jgi:hypothetical protein